MKIIYMFILVFLMPSMFLTACGKSEYEVELEQQDEYCKMVKLFKDTKGQTGWPDFKNTYKDWCLE